MKIPVIIDTDIGTDIDDTWALIMALNSPELDIKLITSATGDTILRAKLIARLLEETGNAHIPIGIGIPLEHSHHNQAAWVDDYDLGSYPASIINDGVGAIVDTIMGSAEPLVIIGLAPLPNISAALRREPRITEKARFVGMQGSIYRGYRDSSEISAEFNVVKYPYACRDVFTAPWSVTITPLDTCGLVQLKGDKYQKVRKHQSAAIQAILENYQIWAKHNKHPLYNGFDPEKESTLLFDTAAIYLAFSEELFIMEELGVRVTGDGFTLIDEQAKTINCAVKWRDLSAFEDLLIERLTR